MILKSVLLYTHTVIQHCRVLQRPPVVLSLTFPELLCYKKPYVIVRNNVGLIESDLKKCILIFASYFKIKRSMSLMKMPHIVIVIKL